MTWQLPFKAVHEFSLDWLVPISILQITVHFLKPNCPYCWWTITAINAWSPIVVFKSTMKIKTFEWAKIKRVKFIGWTLGLSNCCIVVHPLFGKNIQCWLLLMSRDQDHCNVGSSFNHRILNCEVFSFEWHFPLFYQVLKRDIPWETYMTTKLITGTCLQLLRRYDNRSESHRASLLDDVSIVWFILSRPYPEHF